MLKMVNYVYFTTIKKEQYKNKEACKIEKGFVKNE